MNKNRKFCKHITIFVNMAILILTFQKNSIILKIRKIQYLLIIIDIN
jgi:hypothetical protein